jgi:hypothetical protein
MAFLMKQNKPLGPIDVGIFRPDGVMLCVQDVAHLVEQLLGAWFLWHTRAKLHFTPTGGETILHASSRPDRGPAGNVPDKHRMDFMQRLL